MSNDDAATYPVDAVNRVKRRAERGDYDHATVHELLDAAAMCHVSYVIDGQPFCTPTLFWREGTRLYWHGSNSSRMLRNLSEGEPACLTVTHFDSIVLARCGFNHSADYRSVMAFGRARLLADPTEKARALVMMVDRFFPGRTAQLRKSASQEINATSVIAMDIERASAKIRAKAASIDRRTSAAIARAGCWKRRWRRPTSWPIERVFNKKSLICLIASTGWINKRFGAS